MDQELDVPKFSLAERENRWRRVRALMAREGMDAIFAPPNTGLFDQFQANVRYLTGLGGNHSMVAAVFPLEGEVTGICSPDVAKAVWQARQDWVDDIRPISTGWGFAGAVVDRIRELGGVRRLGVTGLAGNTRFPEGIISHGMVRILQEQLPEVELVNANPIMEEARFVKSEEEIGFLRQADRLVEGAIDVLLREARPRVPENVVYARMLASMVEGGSDLPTMILWSAGWPQPPSNAYSPTRRRLQRGDMILTEAEARWGGYCAQNTQPVFLGKAPAKYHDMFAMQQDAIALCYDLLRPGETVGGIAERVAAMSTETYSCAIVMHSRGLGDDSPIAIFKPRDDVMASWRIEENSTFIIKPMVSERSTNDRLYWGDTVVCTAGGAERLGRRPATLLEIDC